MNLSSIHNAGANLDIELAMNMVVVQDASSTNDGVAVSGVAIDRTAVGRFYRSAKVVVPVKFRGSTTKTGTVDISIQDGASSNTFADFSTGAWSSQETFGSASATGAQIVNKILAFDVDLDKARRYLRIQVNANHSAASSGTPGLEDFAYSGHLVFSGADELSVSTSSSG